MTVGNQLKVMVVGSGGREHALAWKIAASDRVEAVYCAPGNGGTSAVAKTTNVDIGVMDFAGLSRFCLGQKVDLVVVGPDNPLAEGIVDVLAADGLRVFGPTRQAARLESSKVFAKEFMVAHRIPTARYMVAESFEQGRDLLKEHPWIRVIKAEGLALGKGVFVCGSEAEGLEALKAVFEERRFGAAGQRVLLEERLEGEELSLLMFVDGRDLALMPACQDHKRRLEGDRGPNTGGMGAYSPVELFRRCQAEIEAQVVKPLAAALRPGQLEYQGVLYAGLMIQTLELEGGVRGYQPFVLEFNARFGDPETQAILPLMASDLVEVLWACTEGSLSQIRIEWTRQASCCVVSCAESYPEGTSAGEPVTLGKMPEADTFVFHAGTKLVAGRLVTAGGRVLAVTGRGANLEEAVRRAYRGLEAVSFPGMAYRKDIARRAVAGCLSQ